MIFVKLKLFFYFKENHFTRTGQNRHQKSIPLEKGCADQKKKCIDAY